MDFTRQISKLLDLDFTRQILKLDDLDFLEIITDQFGKKNLLKSVSRMCMIIL